MGVAIVEDTLVWVVVDVFRRVGGLPYLETNPSAKEGCSITS